MEPLVNKVEESEIELFNLEELWDDGPVVELDLEPFLFEGLIVREKDFREKVKQHDWAQYADKHVAVYCGTDAIIPTWAFMLIASRLEATARSVAFGREADLIRDHFVRALEQVDWSVYAGAPVVIKGCGSKLVPTNAYLLAVSKLQRVAGKIMYGEPCSSVPLWRRPTEKLERTAATRKPAIPTHRID